MKIPDKISRIFIAAMTLFCVVLAIVVITGWIILGFSAVEAATTVPGWVWLVFGGVAAVSGAVSEMFSK